MTVPLRLFLRRSPDVAPGALRVSREIAVKVPTDLSVVEEVVDLVASHCLAGGLPPKAARFNLRVALTEALSNAIKYGNRLDPSKAVEVMVELLDSSFRVVVQDEGTGFDPTTVPDPTTPDRLERVDGRGLFLIRNLVDEVSFNDRGNSICMVLRRA